MPAARQPSVPPPRLPAPLPPGLTAAAFVARYWHRKPLLARAALPAFTGLFTRAELFALAARDEVETRLVVRDGTRWQLAHGPFRRRLLDGLPARDWTLTIGPLEMNFEDTSTAALR